MEPYARSVAFRDLPAIDIPSPQLPELWMAPTASTTPHREPSIVRPFLLPKEEELRPAWGCFVFVVAVAFISVADRDGFLDRRFIVEGGWMLSGLLTLSMRAVVGGER